MSIVHTYAVWFVLKVSQTRGYIAVCLVGDAVLQYVCVRARIEVPLDSLGVCHACWMCKVLIPEMPNTPWQIRFGVATQG